MSLYIANMIALWIILGIVAVIIIFLAVKAIKGVGYWKQCEKEYANMISNGYSEEAALLVISGKRHPELTIETHLEIVQKFNDLPLLVNFFEGALPDGKLDDEYALEILRDTTIECLGVDRYKVRQRE